MGTRRDFLKKSGYASALIPLVGMSGLSFNSQKQKLRLGIIGCGVRGSGIARSIKNNPLFEVVSCCDILPFRLESLSELTGAKPYDDYRAMIDDPNTDAILVASPFGLHDEMAIAALQAGKHVYCEKTMAMGMNEIQQVLDAEQHANVIFQVGHQYNTSDLYQRAEQMVKEGYLGEITAFECQWNRNGDWRRPVPDPKWERIINWRMYREYSGGLTAELCSHQIDFICRLLDEQPKQIAGFGGIDHWKDGRETYDNIHLLYEFPSGIDASFTCTTTNSFENYQIRILGKKATIILDTHKGEIFLEEEAQKEYGLVDGVSGATKTAWSKGKGVEIKADHTNITVQALEQFYYSIFEDKPIIADIRSGAITSKCVQMSLDALYDEKIARWDDYPELKFGNTG